ncbi:MAG: hypothetical protein ABIP95_06905 [Pelobium sp.]
MRNSTLLFLLFAVGIVACRKDEIIDKSSNLKLQFSADSILFDTIFTSVGSTSRILKVFNFNKHTVVLSNVSLAGGTSSAFKININGKSISSLNNLKIKGNDSAYVFVKAFIDPNNSNSPFIVEDELKFSLNGNEQKIPLLAYGQNAVYLNGITINSNTTFTKDKPYIVYNDLIIKEKTRVTINPGTKIYFHNNAKLLVSGSLKANGTLADSITFSSDRLEHIYDDEPGQWKGIHFLSPSFDNTLNYTTVKNALIGIRVDSLSNNNNPKLLITNSIIKNHEVAGVLGYTASITGINNLIYNCGQFLVIGLFGGDYSFYQNTLANYSYNFPRKTPSVFLSDHLNDNSSTLSKSLKSTFVNNIIYGSLSREVDFDKIGNGIFVNTFENNLIKTDLQDLGSSNIYNQDPLFFNPKKEEYKFLNNSPVIGKGKDLSSNVYFGSFLSKDITQKTRVFPSTLGCFEK